MQSAGDNRRVPGALTALACDQHPQSPSHLLPHCFESSIVEIHLEFLYPPHTQQKLVEPTHIPGLRNSLPCLSPQQTANLALLKPWRVQDPSTITTQIIHYLLGKERIPKFFKQI